jgi:hypothetical protein
MSNANEALKYLELLRPGGPWLLTAFQLNGLPRSSWATTAAEVRAFVTKHDGSANVYYSVNPTRGRIEKKAAKVDIARIEFVHADLDPASGESSTAAKERYLAELNGSFDLKPTAIIDSGNGIQAFWRLETPIDLTGFAPVAGTNGKSWLAPEAKVIIDDVEARVEALMLRLGSVAGTQNIDRIMRLPGTTNLPNEKKRGEGRVACSTKLIDFNERAYSIGQFPRLEPGPAADAASQSEKSNEDSGAKSARATKAAPATVGEGWWSGDDDEVERLIRDGASDPDRSKDVWKVVNSLLRGGRTPEAIVRILLDRSYKISDHIYDQADPGPYAQKQVGSAIAKLAFACPDGGGKPFPSQNNIRIALLKMGVTLRYNQFADQIAISGLKGFGPALSDAAIDRLWLEIELRFRFSPKKEKFTTVLFDTARRNSFHPVRNYLDGLRWDGTKRIDKWLTTYGGAKSTAYVDAVGALWLMAGVRGVRQPGCKFDEMPICFGEQGTGRSTMLATIAVRDEWFADDLPILSRGKEVIEMLRGKWIIESPEIRGFKRGEVEQVKSFLSRRFDRGRLVWDKLTSDVPRQCVFAGTTNDPEYLRDNTGNRRVWPVEMGEIKIADLKKDRDQLWAEAAAREAEDGTSIRLNKELWPEAAKEQEARLVIDPYFDALQTELDHLNGGMKITCESLWTILNLGMSQRDSLRLGAAMRRLGWRRPNRQGVIAVPGSKKAVGYVKGDKPWSLIRIERDHTGTLVHYRQEAQGDLLDEET